MTYAFHTGLPVLFLLSIGASLTLILYKFRSSEEVSLDRRARMLFVGVFSASLFALPSLQMPCYSENDRTLAVSHLYHWPMGKMAFQRAGIQAFTVPWHSLDLLLGLPLSTIRGVAALWRYYVRTIASPEARTILLESSPVLTLWAWNGPDDLRFLDPSKVAVAFLAGTVKVGATSITSRPRLRELKVNPGTHLVAAVRIETPRPRSVAITAGQRAQITQQILRMTDFVGVKEVQIDFDARLSERPFYRKLMTDLRREMPPRWRLSMTALSSWCLADPWISDMPVDRAVPMVFRMGDDDARIRGRLAVGKGFGPTVCQGDLGVSTDEPLPRAPSGVRIWAFSPYPWKPDTVRRLTETLEGL